MASKNAIPEDTVHFTGQELAGWNRQVIGLDPTGQLIHGAIRSDGGQTITVGDWLVHGVWMTPDEFSQVYDVPIPEPSPVPEPSPEPELIIEEVIIPEQLSIGPPALFVDKGRAEWGDR